jgi:hypothetical protein
VTIQIYSAGAGIQKEPQNPIIVNEPKRRKREWSSYLVRRILKKERTFGSGSIQVGQHLERPQLENKRKRNSQKAQKEKVRSARPKTKP